MSGGQKFRQRVINGYLAETERGVFRPAEFVDWLAERPENEAYEAFFGRDDATLAREYRIDMARKFASGCRLYFDAEMKPLPGPSEESEFEFPAYVSPLSSRTDGGGYRPFEETLAGTVLEEAEVALHNWLSRYSGAMKYHGLSTKNIEQVAGGIAKTRAGRAA